MRSTKRRGKAKAAAAVTVESASTSRARAAVTVESGFVIYHGVELYILHANNDNVKLGFCVVTFTGPECV